MARHPSLISKAGGCSDYILSRLPRKRLGEEIKIPSQRSSIAIIVLALCCFTTATASAQSFNCHQATKADEIAICHSARVSSLDEQLSSLFLKLRNSLSITQQRVLTSEQQTWLRERATCGSDISCIEKVYEKRLGQLGSPLGSGGAGSNVYQQRDMLAMLKYDGTKAVTLQYGDLLITVDSEPSKSEATSRIPFVQARSSEGAVKFAIHLLGDEDVGQEQPSAQVRIIKLDPASREPQGIFTYNWGGAHCCTITKIAAADAVGHWHIVDGGILDGDGYEFIDLDRNGGGELVSVDNSFLYAFCSYACSYAPSRVKKIVGSELKDVTTNGEYQEFLRYQLRRLETNARSYGEADTIRSPGYLGAWVAAKALVGELSDAWTTMLASYVPDPNWTMEECVRPVPMNQCTEAERREVDFPEALAFHLMVNGYITQSEKQRLASLAKAHNIAKDTTGAASPLATCAAAINDPLRPMIIDSLIAGGKHIAPDWSNAFKSEIEREYGSFLTVRDDATVEKVDSRTGKIRCAVTFQADLQSLAQKVLEEGANARAQVLLRQIAREGRVIRRRLPYTVQRTSGGAVVVWFGFRL
jgi:uncharacterized protein YecT (DUF1311 family)